MDVMQTRQRGLSLIELMVAIAIGSLILLGLVTIAGSGSRNQNELTMLVGQVDNAKYALKMLRDDIQHAGFYGRFFSPDDPPNPTSTALPDPCVTAAASLDDVLGLPVQGYDGPADGADPLNCLDDDDHIGGTDILVIRRADTGTETAGALTDGEVYIQTTTSATVLAAEDNDTTNDLATFNLQDGSLNPAPIRRYRVHIYFLSPCNVQGGATCSAASDDGNPIPTLKRLVLTDDGAGGTSFQMEALAEGVENLQIEYGVDTQLDDGSPDLYAVPDGTTTQDDWTNVMTTRIFLLARNRNESRGYTDPKTYTLSTDGTVTSTPGGSYRRNLFTATTMLTNVSQRRSTSAL